MSSLDFKSKKIQAAVALIILLVLGSVYVNLVRVDPTTPPPPPPPPSSLSDGERNSNPQAQEPIAPVADPNSARTKIFLGLVLLLVLSGGVFAVVQSRRASPENTKSGPKTVSTGPNLKERKNQVLLALIVILGLVSVYINLIQGAAPPAPTAPPGAKIAPANQAGGAPDTQPGTPSKDPGTPDKPDKPDKPNKPRGPQPEASPNLAFPGTGSIPNLGRNPFRAESGSSPGDGAAIPAPAPPPLP